jgi:hypothetical protein
MPACATSTSGIAITAETPALAFFETKPTKGIMVVEAMSADPCIPGVRPLPVDSDHTAICKPASRDTTLYRTVRRFVEDAFHDSKQLRNRTSVGDPQIATERLDVFISHSSVQKEWVEALADNLQRAGKSVFLDLWRADLVFACIGPALGGNSQKAWSSRIIAQGVQAPSWVQFPGHLRGPVWNLSAALPAIGGLLPYMVSRKTYVTETKDGRLSLEYESQLIHAIVRRRSGMTTIWLSGGAAPRGCAGSNRHRLAGRRCRFDGS